MKNCIDCNVVLNVNELYNRCHNCKQERIMDFGKLNESSTGSKRFNEGKPEVSQLDPRFIMDLADLITKSANKYGKYNYALGQEYHTPYDSLMRHANKFWQGEDLDSESCLHHVLHMAANCMILYTSILANKDNEKKLDTRHDWE